MAGSLKEDKRPNPQKISKQMTTHTQRKEERKKEAATTSKQQPQMKRQRKNLRSLRNRSKMKEIMAIKKTYQTSNPSPLEESK